MAIAADFELKVDELVKSMVAAVAAAAPARKPAIANALVLMANAMSS
ncbi:hypothetical protein [Roseitranquillus sediminis]|nr:hypothetical protein [Roseitranquillus sediminis]